jgi:hypothetical protein
VHQNETPVIGSWYEVVTLKTALETTAKKLERILRETYSVVADGKRSGFFELTSGDDWFYIHTYKTSVYLLAYRKLKSAEDTRSPHPKLQSRSTSAGHGASQRRSRHPSRILTAPG